MRDFYKVVREDFTDCYSGTLRYAVGEVTRHPSPTQPSDAIRCDDACGAGGLHACHRLEDAVLYRQGQWPVRLLRVSAADEDLQADDGHKIRSAALRGEEELPLALAFGPRGEEVVAFIGSLAAYPWLQADNSQAEAAIEAAEEHMRRLVAYGGTILPVEIRPMMLAAAAAYAATHAAATHAAAAAYAAAYAARVAAYAATRDAAAYAARVAAYDAARAPARTDAANAAARAPARTDAANAAAYMVVADLLPDRPNPFLPLMQIWRAGYLPIGAVDGVFVVASVARTNEEA